ncbi:MAG: LPS assembly lipoprotein LptE [Verrucomicrobiales bacterium]
MVTGLIGCAGYRLGPTNGSPAGARSIQINLFQNQTMEPRLSESVGMAMRRILQQDGTYRLATQDDGDIVVTGVINNFSRNALSFQPADVVTARDYTLTMRAHVIATEAATGKVILDANVTGRTTLRVGADLSSAERQAVPLMAEDLARNVSGLLVDGSW